MRDTWGSIDFRRACDGHDACYATQGKKKDQCDTQFLVDMQAACRSSYPDEGLAKRGCYALANEYYTAVWGFAGSAYDDAQACLDDALSRTEAGIRSFIIELKSRSKSRRDRGENEATAANLAKGTPIELRQQVDDDMAAIRAATNEIALYKVMLANATPVDATQAQIIAHGVKVKQVQDVVDELKALHDEVRDRVDAKLGDFSSAQYNEKVMTEAAKQATARFDQIDAKLADASAALAAARRRVGIGPDAPADQAELERAADLMYQANNMVDHVATFVHVKIVQALAAELRPLRDAVGLSARGRERAFPIYARGRNLVGKPLYTVTVDNRPPPPPPSR